MYQSSEEMEKTFAANIKSRINPFASCRPRESFLIKWSDLLMVVPLAVNNRQEDTFTETVERFHNFLICKGWLDDAEEMLDDAVNATFFSIGGLTCEFRSTIEVLTRQLHNERYPG